MQKPVRYYIQTTGEQPVVRSVSVDKPAEEKAVRQEAVQQLPRQSPTDSVSGVRRIRAAIKRGGL
jgi:hypothetical protein